MTVPSYELERLAPPADPQLSEAEELLANFASFWERQPSRAERHPPSPRNTL